MTTLGLYLAKRATNKALVARRTGLSKIRVLELCSNEKTKLKASELYLIAKAIEVSPCELLELICADLELVD